MEGREWRQTASGLRWRELRPGTGAQPGPAAIVTVHYTGRLSSGEKFDSSHDRGQPAEFPLGGVIVGWAEGVQLMRCGACFEFEIPPALAYGERGAGQVIGPGATLHFDVELLSFR